MSRVIHDFRLEIHALSHTDFMCAICDKKHTTYRELFFHKKSHEQKLSCNECDKSFRKKSALDEHKLTHSVVDTPALFSCDICDEQFESKSKLTIHKRKIHDITKTPKKTEVKTAQFKTTSNGLIEICPKPNTFDCDICYGNFGSQAELSVHRREAHLKPAVFTCSTCGRLGGLKWIYDVISGSYFT